MFEYKDFYAYEISLISMFVIDVFPHTLTSEWIVMTNARVFHNNEIHNNERTPSLLTVSIALLQNLVGREKTKMLKILNICLLLTRLQTFIVLLCAYEYVKNLIILYTSYERFA